MRTKTSTIRARKRKRLLKAAKGYWGRKHNVYRVARQAVQEARQYGWIGRKQKKRDWRRLWITRISAALRMRGMNYARFFAGMKRANIELNRQVLADLAVCDPAAFDCVVAVVRGQNA
jgi:large subunit ribosomal protein L20